jgi:hypothetical protein
MLSPLKSTLPRLILDFFNVHELLGHKIDLTVPFNKWQPVAVARLFMDAGYLTFSSPSSSSLSLPGTVQLQFPNSSVAAAMNEVYLPSSLSNQANGYGQNLFRHLCNNEFVKAYQEFDKLIGVLPNEPLSVRFYLSCFSFFKFMYWHCFVCPYF